MLIGANYLWWNSAEQGWAAHPPALPNAPLVVITNLGKLLGGVAHAVLGWTLWRMWNLGFLDGRRWPSIALAMNCFLIAAAFFADVLVLFLPVYVIHAAIVNLAAWATLSAAVLFPIWLRQYRIEITKE